MIYNVKYIEFRKKKNQHDSRVGYRAVKWYDDNGNVHFASYENFQLMFPDQKINRKDIEGTIKI